MIWKCWCSEGCLGKDSWVVGQRLLEGITLISPVLVPSYSLTLWGLYLTYGSCG